MSEQRITQIRAAEAYSHTEAYHNLKLFEPGSWLSKPVPTVMELIPNFLSYREFRGLDLGCGIGRNCIPVLQALSDIPCVMDCVDILPLAIEKLSENAKKYQVTNSINGIVCAADRYPVKENHYDLILGLSVLEHLDSTDTLNRKLREIFAGLRPGGIACFVINTSIKEHDLTTGQPMEVQFEINLSADKMQEILNTAFEGMDVLKNTLIHYQYETYRESGMVRLDTDLLTYAVRKRN